MSSALPPYPAHSGPAAATALSRRINTIDGLIASLEAALDHLDSAFAAGLEVADRRISTQDRLRRMAGGKR